MDVRGQLSNRNPTNFRCSLSYGRQREVSNGRQIEAVKEMSNEFQMTNVKRTSDKECQTDAICKM